MELLCSDHLWWTLIYKLPRLTNYQATKSTSSKHITELPATPTVCHKDTSFSTLRSDVSLYGVTGRLQYRWLHSSGSTHPSWFDDKTLRGLVWFEMRKLSWNFIVTSSRPVCLPPIVTAAAKKWHRVENNNVSFNSSGIIVNTLSWTGCAAWRAHWPIRWQLLFRAITPWCPMPTCHELVINRMSAVLHQGTGGNTTGAFKVKTSGTGLQPHSELCV